ncbi:hypothetical protein C8F04DRAFT_678599 [Mycena alexandri]|uniref:Uncharacterized protein n=1 Tax=Mycena alexandri TaxID=1745969 RepID=A0AAD6XDB2_9AGAR|nr:hypothetical protein C8F04DRAFT_678599 [Mycena alexandri]
MSSVRLHKLRRGVGVYATGFILSCTQLTAISLAVCDEAFRKKYKGDPVFALKWHVDRYNYELLPMEDGDDTVPHLFAISFFPYLKDATTSDKLFCRLTSLSDERKNTWHERFGQYAGLALKDLEPHTMRYPTHGATAHFLGQELQAAINANKELWDCLVPLPSPLPVLLPSYSLSHDLIPL